MGASELNIDILLLYQGCIKFSKVYWLPDKQTFEPGTGHSLLVRNQHTERESASQCLDLCDKAAVTDMQFFFEGLLDRPLKTFVP